MPVITPRDICTDALRKAGVTGTGVVPMAEDINIAFTTLNDMLAQWQVDRWNVFCLTDTSFISTGAQSYTVGPAGNFPFIERPDRLEAAYLRQLFTTNPQQPIDYFLQLIESREDYSRIALKKLGTISKYCFYSPDYPVGNVFPWPIPMASLYELHLIFKTVIGGFTNLSQNINLPRSYHGAMKWSLAEWLCGDYNYDVPPIVTVQAKKAVTVLQNSNAQIPALQMPRTLQGNAGMYNVFSDQIY